MEAQGVLLLCVLIKPRYLTSTQHTQQDCVYSNYTQVIPVSCLC